MRRGKKNFRWSLWNKRQRIISSDMWDGASESSQRFQAEILAINLSEWTLHGLVFSGQHDDLRLVADQPNIR